MTEYFRIEGKNLIDFDAAMVVPASIPVYNLNNRMPPGDMSKPLTRQEIISLLPRLPLGVRGHALNRGMSMVTFPFSIQADTDPEMEQALHDLKETLNEGQLYIESESARGTRAVLRYKSDNAVNHSYKTIYYGFFDERNARDVLGAKVKEHYLDGLQLTLYMEPMWRPSTAVMLGPNEIYCPGLEEDGNADGLADNWVILNAPTLTIESTIVLQGFYSQKVVTGAFISRGIQSATFVAPAATTTAICYAWIARPAAGSNIIVECYDTVGVVRGSALYNTAGWDSALAKDGVTTFYRVEVSVAAGIVPGNTHRMRIYNTVDTGATYYVDKCFWKWGTTTVPDEWCDHSLIYNHYDTTEGAAHVGHQNYVDVADLKGTDEARLSINVKFEQKADAGHAGDLLIGRRSWWEYPSHVASIVRDVHWLEAEDRDAGANWAPAVLARCSAGACVSNGANVSGNVTFLLLQEPGGVGRYTTNSLRGRHDVFGVVYTSDPVNTQYRLSYTNFSMTIRFFNLWVKQPLAEEWQIIYLGEVNFDKFLRDDLNATDAYIDVEYLKDALQSVSLDCIWLLRKTEPTTRLHTLESDWLEENNYWHFDRTEDFDYEEKEADIGGILHTLGELCLQGDIMTLTPKMVVGQRLYFSAETAVVAPTPDERIWEAHGPVNPLQMTVDMAYLPQYQTPLD